ncbi:homoserine kinase [Deinococcus misasensis]|uniref:homoserine kinase n=1 Tax=Deinococcus misasensis TaxID=392413 RepID=UPI000B27C22E|nr:homoserine kinase [Deinococcus misasensis]
MESHVLPHQRNPMNTGTTIEVKAPASSANLGPGFDCVGISFALYTTVRVKVQEVLEIVPIGKDLEGTPRDETNIVYQAMLALAQEAGQVLPPVRLEIESGIPLARGLGSSAAALVAGMVAANELLGKPLNTQQLFDLASRLEGHPDNAGASLVGGAVVATFDGQTSKYLQFQLPQHLRALLVVPQYALETSKARGVLPETYSRSDMVFQLSHAALLAAGLASGNLTVFKEAMRDRLHQPYRAALVPGLLELLEGAPGHGALGAALSGAGPSVLCFYEENTDLSGLKNFLTGVLEQHGVTALLEELPLDNRGVLIQTL